MSEHETLPIAINDLVKSQKIKTDLISDGYHTFGELYDHRITLFIALCRVIALRDYNATENPVWRKLMENDDATWFLLGIGTEAGKQITYHLPIHRWDECVFAKTLEKGEFEWDGHTGADVLKRLSVV